MSTPILPAKFQVPALPGFYLPRGRLDRQWAGWRDKRLVLVTAGAGFGKTSFLAANVRNAAGRCLWYSLDELDAGLPAFCGHLLALVSPGNDLPPWAGDQDDPNFPDRALAHLIQCLKSGDAGPRLVLDDLQLVAGSDGILRFLDRLLRFIPEGATLVLASREQLPLTTQKLRSMGTVASLISRDLAFSPAEVQELFHRHFDGARLSGDISRRIIEQTEGWAAGVEIFFQLLEGTSEALIEASLERMSAAGPGWFAYFTEEVVRKLDPDTRDFLHRSSILPRLDARLCDRVLGRSDSREILEGLCRRGLFTYAASDERDGYRYHHLFREFLRDRLERALDPGELNRLRLQAAGELEQAGAWVEAAAAYAECGDFSSVLGLVDQHGEDLRSSGHYELLRHALEAVPADLLDEHPAALATLGRTNDIRGRWDEAQRLYRRALDLLPAGPRRTELTSLVAKIEMRLGNYEASLSLCGKELEATDRESAPARAKIHCIAGGARCDLGELDHGQRHYLDAISLFRKNGDPRGEGYANYLLAVNVHQFRGEFREAKEAARRSLQIFNRLNDPHRICRGVGVLGFVLACAGEVREARELNAKALMLGRSLEDRMVLGYAHWSLGHCARLADDAAGAREHFHEARRLGDELGEMLLRIYPLIGLAELALEAGDTDEARRHASRALEIAESKEDLLLRSPCYTVLGLAELSSDPQRAVEHWSRGEALMRRLGATAELHRLLLIRLDAGAADRGQQPALLEALLAGARRMGHDFIFLLIEPARAARVLPLALGAGIEPEYAARLLVVLGPPAVAGLVPLTAAPSDNVRTRAVDLLTRIGGDEAREALGRIASTGTKTGRSALRASEELERRPPVPLRIQALGGLVITCGERRLSLADWKSARALRLFQLLLVNRFRWIHRDVAAEWLWPESEPGRGANNLRQVIYLLRKTLEPGLDKPRDSNYIRYLNEACRLEPGEHHVFDVEAFEEEAGRADELWKEGDRDGARGHLERAAALYRGNFLEESPYEEFLVVAREELREKLLRVLCRLIEVQAGAGRWEELVPHCRKGLAQDPYHEDFSWNLVRAQHELGNRREALAAYHQYEEMMTRELELLPSARMKDLADQVSAHGRSKQKRPPR